MDNFAIGVDIGGSHITAAVVDLNLKTVIRESRIRQHVNSSGEAAEIIFSWCKVIRAAFPKDLKNVRVGIAMPGPFDYEQGISYITGLGKYENLFGINVKELLRDILGTREESILMNNDAACFLHGEMFAGAGRGCSSSIAVTLGTGTGTATHRSGLTKDANLGPSKFLDSIADEYLSTRWFVNQYRELQGESVRDVKELALRYHYDPIVRDLFARFAYNLALLLKDFVTNEKPEIVILGGNIAQAHELFLPITEMILRENGIGTPILRAVLGEDATILGAASLFTKVGKIISA